MRCKTFQLKVLFIINKKSLCGFILKHTSFFSSPFFWWINKTHKFVPLESMFVNLFMSQCMARNVIKLAPVSVYILSVPKLKMKKEKSTNIVYQRKKVGRWSSSYTIATSCLLLLPFIHTTLPRSLTSSTTASTTTF